MQVLNFRLWIGIVVSGIAGEYGHPQVFASPVFESTIGFRSSKILAQMASASLKQKQNFLLTQTRGCSQTGHFFHSSRTQFQSSRRSKFKISDLQSMESVKYLSVDPFLTSPSFMSSDAKYRFRSPVRSPVRASGRLPTFAQGARNSPGISLISVQLTDSVQMMKGTDQNAGYIPSEIGEKLVGKNFESFNHFKICFWQTVAQSKYASEFDYLNQVRMKNGLSPYVSESQSNQDRMKFELHHIVPIHQGGDVYDLSNIMIATPRYHREVLCPEYHY